MSAPARRLALTLAAMMFTAGSSSISGPIGAAGTPREEGSGGASSRSQSATPFEVADRILQQRYAELFKELSSSNCAIFSFDTRAGPMTPTLFQVDEATFGDGRQSRDMFTKDGVRQNQSTIFKEDKLAGLTQSGYFNPKPFNEDSNLILLTKFPIDAVEKLGSGTSELVTLIFDESDNLADLRRTTADPAKFKEKSIYYASGASLPPGSYQCRVVARNLETGEAAVASAKTFVPKPLERGIRLHAPLLFVPGTNALYLEGHIRKEKAAGAGVQAGSEISVKIWLFRGTWMDDPPRPRQIEILSGVSHPELAALKTLAGGPADEFKAAAIDALLDIKNLKALDDLFLIEKAWDDSRPFISDAVVAKQLAYRLDLFFNKAAPAQVATRAVLSKTKEGVIREGKDPKRALENALAATQDDEKMEKILDRELILLLDYPFIVAVPDKEGAYFLTILLSEAKAAPKPATPPKVKTSVGKDIASAPNALRQVRPIYPEELRRLGVKGTIGLRLTIDEKGRVERAEVFAPLHPYLDYSAVLAFREWTFEPVIRNGKPIRAKFTYAYDFNPRSYAEERSQDKQAPAAAEQTGRGDLSRILAGCAEYCRKLADSALFFICEETIKETHHQLKPPQELSDMFFKHTEVVYQAPDGGGIAVAWRVQIMDPNRTERRSYLCDYQLIKKGEIIEQRRIILKENGRPLPDRTTLLEETRYAVLKPIFASLQVLAQDRQPLFAFRLLDEERIRGKNAFVVEAGPKSGNADGVLSAKIWVEKTGFRILKSEIAGVPVDGYEDVLKDCVLLNIEPDFVTIHEYRVDKNGVLFPENSTVRVEYRGLVPGRPVSKLETDLTYGKYKFFTVETGHEVVK